MRDYPPNNQEQIRPFPMPPFTFSQLKAYAFATPLRGLLTGFAITRLLTLFPLHINMQTGHLPTLMHIIWPLPHTLAENLTLMFNMPGQPPGFQAFVYILSLLAPAGFIAIPAFIAYTLMGLSLCFAFYSILTTLSIPPKPAAIFTFLIMISSGFILFERTILYTYPIITLLTWGLASTLRATQTPNNLRLWASAIVCFTIPCWLHSFFQPLFPLVMGGILLAFIPATLRFQFTAISLACLLFASLPAIKNGIFYNHFISSSWSGLSLSRVMAYPATQDELTALTPYGVDPDFINSSKEFTPPLLQSFLVTPTHSLTTPAGAINFQHPVFWDISTALRAQSHLIFTNNPNIYARGVMAATYVALHSPTDWFYTKNKKRLRPYDCLWQVLTTGTPTCPQKPTALRMQFGTHTPLHITDYLTHGKWKTFPFLTPIYLILLAWWNLRNIRIPATTSTRPFWILLFIIWSYTLSLSTLIELDESQRLRFYATPALFLLAATLGYTLYNKIAARKTSATHP